MLSANISGFVIKQKKKLFDCGASLRQSQWNSEETLVHLIALHAPFHCTHRFPIADLIESETCFPFNSSLRTAAHQLDGNV